MKRGRFEGSAFRAEMVMTIITTDILSKLYYAYTCCVFFWAYFSFSIVQKLCVM